MVEPGAIAALGETGEIADLAAIRGFLRHERAKVRRAAAVAMARLNLDGCAVELATLLGDSSSRVRGAVGAALAAAPLHLWVKPARRFLENGSAAVQRSALRTMLAFGGWSNMVEIVRGLASEFALVREDAFQAAQGWLERYGSNGWLHPGTDDVAELRLLWPRVLERVADSEWTVELYRQVLRRWIEGILHVKRTPRAQD